MKVTALTVLALLLATSAQAAEKPSQSFLKKAIQGNYAEVEMGKLAQQNGQSDNVKNFGRMLQADHTAQTRKPSTQQSRWA
jgi:putative membrane protein